MLHSDVKPLGYDSVSNLFVDDNSEGSGVNVKDSAGSSVIVFVRHGLVNGTIDNDVNDITDLVSGEILGHTNSTVASEPLLEFMSGSSFISVTMSHWS